ncbi:hypothetical protein ACFIOY_05750 [Bradyrhizobium sp. TZ2]
MKVDERYLKLHPDPLGPQHDEREPGWLRGRIKWTQGLRKVQDAAILHSTVLERFAASEVQHYYRRMIYRPENLKAHSKVRQYYEADAPTEGNAPENGPVEQSSGVLQQDTVEASGADTTRVNA